MSKLSVAFESTGWSELYKLCIVNYKCIERWDSENEGSLYNSKEVCMYIYMGSSVDKQLEFKIKKSVLVKITYITPFF